MPKIIVPQASIWVEFGLETELISPPKIKLKIGPVFKKDAVYALLETVRNKGAGSMAAIGKTAELVLEKVFGWDLEDEKGIIPCSDKNKKKYLTDLLWEDPEMSKKELSDKKLFDESAKAAALKKEKETGKPVIPDAWERKEVWFWVRLLNQMADISNFIKN